MGAAIVGGVAYVLGMAMAVGLRLAAGDIEDMLPVAALPVSQLAGLFALVFARVPVSFDGVLMFAQRVFGEAAFTLSFLTAFVLLAVLLIWAGGRVVRTTGAANPLEAAVQGAKVGVVYGVLVFAGAVFFGLDGEQGVTIGVSSGVALGWGLLSGVLFGAWGGLRTRGGLQGLAGGSTAPRRFWGAATVAAVWGLGVGLLLMGVLAIVVGLVVTIDVDGFSFLSEHSGWALAGAVVGFLLLVPNLAVDLLVFGHGGTVELPAVIFGISGETVAVNYLSWPIGGVESATAPLWTLMLVLIPLLSVVLAGYWAVGLAGVRTREEARTVGLRVGIPYAVAVWAVAGLARLEAEGFLSVGQTRFAGDWVLGPSLATAFLLPLLWGVAGGSLGARLATPRGAHRPAPAPTATGVGEPVPVGTVACSSCGIQLGADKRFCTSCGAEQPQDQPVPEAEEVTPEAAPGGLTEDDTDAAGEDEKPDVSDEEVLPSPETSSSHQQADSTMDDHGGQEKRCSQCSAENLADNRFCSTCGRPLEDS